MVSFCWKFATKKTSRPCQPPWFWPKAWCFSYVVVKWPMDAALNNPKAPTLSKRKDQPFSAIKWFSPPSLKYPVASSIQQTKLMYLGDTNWLVNSGGHEAPRARAELIWNTGGWKEEPGTWELFMFALVVAIDGNILRLRYLKVYFTPRGSVGCLCITQDSW